MRAECYMQFGDIKSAVANFRKAVLLPEGKDLYADRLVQVLDLQGIMYSHERQYDLAIACFTDAIQIATKEQFFLRRAICKMMSPFGAHQNSALSDFLLCEKYVPFVYIARGELLIKRNDVSNVTIESLVINNIQIVGAQKELAKALMEHSTHIEVKKFGQRVKAISQELRANGLVLLMEQHYEEAARVCGL